LVNHLNNLHTLCQNSNQDIAGLSVAQVALKMNETNIHVLVGPGNNGADGLAAAKFLAQARKNVTVWYPIQRDKQEYKVRSLSAVTQEALLI